MSSQREPRRRDEDLRVLVLAPTGRDAAVTCGLLEQAGVACEEVGSAAELCARLEHLGGVAVVAEEALDWGGVRALDAVLADQPSWSDPPVVLLGSRNRAPTRLRALVQRRSTALLRRPLQVSTFLSVVRAAVENRRRQLEVRALVADLRTSNRRLAERARQLQALALQLTEAEEAERRRLAMLLHDDLQQLLAAAGFRIMAMEASNGEPERLLDHLASLKLLLGEAGNLARDLSRELDPPGLRRGGLVPALEWLAQQMLEHHGLTIDLDARSDAEPGDERVNRVLFRAARELLFNVVKHASCERAKVQLARDGDRAVLAVRDDGCGFDPATVGPTSAAGGFGVLSIRERIDLLGGRFVIDSRPGGGTRVELGLPLAPSGGQLPVPDAPERRQRLPGLEPKAEHHRSGVLRVLLVDDHAVMRQGLRALLAGEPAIEVVGEASNGVEALSEVERLRPDVVVMDASMPVMDGPEATRRIRQRHPETRVIGLSMFDDREMAETMHAAGAERYLSKSGPGQDLVAALRGAIQGRAGGAA